MIGMLKLQLFLTRSKPLPGARDPKSMIAESGFLVFKTLNACFSVRNNLAHETNLSLDIYPYGVYNRWGERIGKATLNSNSQPPPAIAEFIVLCKRHPEHQLRFAPRHPGEQPDEQWAIMNDVKYGILMIEIRKGTAYKLGQGTISMPKWDEESTDERLIVLG
ncbi:hypothetical protein BU25DRAFT_458043 [Macroventuria anomochaeta]|uniref:Uncharacterized protein n=1 Tax=Macroventuria anomochaeta TaxID=301207 RepID=A0ACB6S4Q7_9PLEO|nr:uncharacterized protein BU25DRAFT_458043 [Macroventuria anomochaeta]KAF2628194.1 hypothetical protein BU25DRAFT_458043 [Macroventuria anomochaeta]